MYRHCNEGTIIIEFVRLPNTWFGESEIQILVIIFHFSFLKKEVAFQATNYGTMYFSLIFFCIFIYTGFVIKMEYYTVLCTWSEKENQSERLLCPHKTLALFHCWENIPRNILTYKLV